MLLRQRECQNFSTLWMAVGRGQPSPQFVMTARSTQPGFALYHRFCSDQAGLLGLDSLQSSDWSLIVRWVCGSSGPHTSPLCGPLEIFNMKGTQSPHDWRQDLKAELEPWLQHFVAELSGLTSGSQSSVVEHC